MSRLIYLDNAATTQVYPEVVDAMLPYFTEHYGNPSAIYSFADEAERAVDHARGEVADLIGAKKDEIYFTGGGSESDNWALKATAEAYAAKGKHIITSAIEHHAILHTAQWLEKHGFEVTYVGVDEDGKIKLDELKAAIRPDTILISVMAANNEIGTIQPLKEIGEIAKEHDILFHTDAVQAFGHIPINVDDMHIDMLSASGHKLNGPKGIGSTFFSSFGFFFLSFWLFGMPPVRSDKFIMLILGILPKSILVIFPRFPRLPKLPLLMESKVFCIQSLQMHRFGWICIILPATLSGLRQM